MGWPEAIFSSLWGTWRADSRPSLEPLCWPPGAPGEGGLPVPPGHPGGSQGHLQEVGVAVPSGRDIPPDSLDEVGAYCGGVSRTKTFMTEGVGSNSTTRPKSSLKARLRLWGRAAVHTHRP